MSSALEETEALARERIFREILGEFTPAEIGRLLDALQPAPVELIGAPESGLIMITARDGGGEAFHLGEALATVAEVEFTGRRSHATVLGGEPERAVLAATVGALARQPEGHPWLKACWSLLAEGEARVRAARAETERLIAATRVSFQGMAAEEI